MKISLAVLQCAFGAWAFLAAGAASSATPASVQSEVRALMATLAASGCEFQRNGNWYTGEKARQHLLRKLDYIEQRGGVNSAEQFVELAATESSLSGKPYQVRCAGAAVVPSSAWLLDALKKVRQGQPASSRNPG